jgi:hypothetical protein
VPLDLSFVNPASTPDSSSDLISNLKCDWPLIIQEGIVGGIERRIDAGF